MRDNRGNYSFSSSHNYITEIFEEDIFKKIIDIFCCASENLKLSFTFEIRKTERPRHRENVSQLHCTGTYILGIIIFCGGKEAKREANEEPVRS